MGDGPHARRSLHSPPHLTVQSLGGECSLALPDAEVGLAHVPYLYLSLVVTAKSGRDVTFILSTIWAQVKIYFHNILTFCFAYEVMLQARQVTLAGADMAQATPGPLPRTRPATA